MSSERVFNFSAGPACVPVECLEAVSSELFNWKESGMSVLECSHRSSQWSDENEDVNKRLRALLNVPDNFEILLVAGGASLQFSAIPFNLLGDFRKVDYLVTGTWSQKAYEECQRLEFDNVEVHSVAPLPLPSNPTDLPDRSKWSFSEDAAYCYLCQNETIQGIQFKSLPDAPAPLVVDMSSDFLSRPITEWDKIGLCFACAQKNFGCAGLSVVIVRSDLLNRKLAKHCPLTLDYRLQVKHSCMYNTPPTFPIYFANLVFKWIERQGGVEAIAKRNREQARRLYDAIDKSPHFENRVNPDVRSEMNCPFFRRPDGYETKKPELDQLFLKFAESRRLVSLKGHAAVGGFRASIYNAMSDAGVDELIKAIEEFAGFDA